MNNKNRWPLGIILILLIPQTSISNAVIFKLTNAVCESYNKSWVTFEHCRLRAYNREIAKLNINATFIYPAYNIDLKIKILKKANGYKPWLFDFTFDACEFMRKRNHPVAKVVHNLIKNVSSVTHTCPYVGYQWVKEFYPRAEIIPGVLPTGEYLILMTWIFDKKPQFVTNVYWEFVE